jgi:hypothetical protein
MKKGIFLLASISMLMLAGCGESSSGATTASGSTGSTNTTPTTPTVGNSDVPGATTADAQVTTANNLFKIADDIGVPPALPGK